MTYDKAKKIVGALNHLGDELGVFVNLLKEKQKLAEVQAKIEEIEGVLVHSLMCEGAYDVIGEKADGTKIVNCPHQREPLENLTIDEYHAAADLVLRNMVLDQNSTIKEMFG